MCTLGRVDQNVDEHLRWPVIPLYPELMIHVCTMVGVENYCSISLKKIDVETFRN